MSAWDKDFIQRLLASFGHRLGRDVCGGSFPHKRRFGSPDQQHFSRGRVMNVANILNPLAEPLEPGETQVT
jgi:hypothetical protein